MCVGPSKYQVLGLTIGTGERDQDQLEVTVHKTGVKIRIPQLWKGLVFIIKPKTYEEMSGCREKQCTQQKKKTVE